MNVILPKGSNLAAEKEAVKQSAQRVAKHQEEIQITEKTEINEILNKTLTEEADNLEMRELASLLSLPEEKFAILAPIFLAELNSSLQNSNAKMLSAHLMNATGMTLENVEEQIRVYEQAIDENTGDLLSSQKRDFLKQIIGLSFNLMEEAEGIAKKKILIPLEYCHEGAKIPTYAHLTDAGMDIYALEDITIAPGETKLVPTGLKVAIPSGYELQVRPKSGRCLKTKLRVANTPGTIDAGYRDEIGVIIDNIEPFIKSAQMDEAGRLYDVEYGSSYTIGKGEKFAQLVLSEVPKAIFYQVESVAGVENDGRAGGFGSSGLK